ncbi:MAG TPA: zinc ribbon domain-containing protein [Burkholderiales bacterium]|jgi:putative FmdB family regulatory protein|nr:zinc ribbon domain-containing protein [Burkholderiales bacterium]
MPIYEYRCSECGQDHEVLQKVSEPPLTECPACGKPALQKQLSAAGFQLKGSGWYATDFKGSGKKPEKKAEAKTEAKTEVKAETKSETKSAETKTESKPASTSTTTD